MKHLTAATVAVALILALAGCGSDKKSDNNKTSSTGTATSTSTTTTTSATPGASTPVHRGDPGSPTINLPMPPGWQVSNDINTSYGGIVLAQPANPADPPTIAAIVFKLTGDVDAAKIIQYAPGALLNLPGYQGTGNGTASTLSGFQAWQLSATYVKDGKTRTAAQKTVVIPGQGGVFVLELEADSSQSDQGQLLDAMNVVDDQTTISL
jgi:hypothetical protein